MSTTLNPVNYSQPVIKQMNELGFDFAFKTFMPITPDYGSLLILKVVREKIFNEEKNQTETIQTNNVLATAPCTVDNFNHTDKEEIVVKGIPGAYSCITNKSEL